MTEVCNIVVDIIDEDTVIGDSWATFNKNFEQLDDIVCSVTTKGNGITTSLIRINSLDGEDGIEVTPKTGIVTVAQAYSDPWHVGRTKLPLYNETEDNRKSLQIINNSRYLKNIQYVISQNPPYPGNETIESRLTGVTFVGVRHCDVVTLGDGRVFFVPHSYDRGVIYDSKSNEFTQTPNIVGTGFASGCLLPDGRVCMIPGTSAKIYFWDPKTETTTISNIDISRPGVGQPYNGGVLLSDGRIMLIPYERNDGTLIYDPKTDTIIDIIDSLFNIPGGKGFFGGQLVDDGTVVIMTPHNSTYSIRVDTGFPYSVNIADVLSSSFPGNMAYGGAVLLPDGRIYFVPHNANIGVIYDPVTDNFTNANGVFPGNAAYKNGFLLPDGRVCMPPFGPTENRIAFYNPATNTTMFSVGVGGFGFKYSAGTVLEDGSVIIAPYTQPTALFLNIGAQTSFSRPILTSPLFCGGV